MTELAVADVLIGKDRNDGGTRVGEPAGNPAISKPFEGFETGGFASPEGVTGYT
jgi:hypothetical protein